MGLFNPIDLLVNRPTSTKVCSELLGDWGLLDPSPTSHSPPTYPGHSLPAPECPPPPLSSPLSLPRQLSLAGIDVSIRVNAEAGCSLHRLVYLCVLAWLSQQEEQICIVACMELSRAAQEMCAGPMQTLDCDISYRLNFVYLKKLSYCPRPMIESGLEPMWLLRTMLCQSSYSLQSSYHSVI